MTPPDYKAKAREIEFEARDGQDRIDRIAAFATQADALGYARGREEALGSPELREALAALCHEQWSGWMKYLFSKCSRMEFGSWVIPRLWVERWQRQMGLEYDRLRDDEKNSDRKEADRILSLMSRALTAEPAKEEK